MLLGFGDISYSTIVHPIPLLVLLSLDSISFVSNCFLSCSLSLSLSISSPPYLRGFSWNWGTAVDFKFKITVTKSRSRRNSASASTVASKAKETVKGEKERGRVKYNLKRRITNDFFLVFRAEPPSFFLLLLFLVFSFDYSFSHDFDEFDRKWNRIN